MPSQKSGIRDEQERLDENAIGDAPWHRWGPYLSERQWGTVREDYSPGGTAWDYFPHDEARSRAYRWGEDGILGVCDRRGHLCIAAAMWNGKDPILKERMFGLTNSEGNHGEDVKECYYFLDNTPTHSYMRGLYQYPQAAFPYEELVRVNGERGKDDPEYELTDTSAFAENRYFDVEMEMAKASPEDLVIRYTITNRGPDRARLVFIPQAWFRNNWSYSGLLPPNWICATDGSYLEIDHPRYGERRLAYSGAPTLMFTHNVTNNERIFGAPSDSPYVRDAFHRAIVSGEEPALNPARVGSKAGLRYDLDLAPGESREIYLQLTELQLGALDVDGARAVLERRKAECDAFYEELTPGLAPQLKTVQRQAFAGLLWSKQFYEYKVRAWLMGDPSEPPPPKERLKGRNRDWQHLYASDILTMPDTWEYPWFASWDLAFHCIPMALVDPGYAKGQLLLLLREWYMHPNGQIPAYEWAFGDVNPPVHAWAVWRVYSIERRAKGQGDRAFLERAFHKLLLNFTWWVNRKDAQGNNVFEGGFLGLDNIGVFDRNKPFEDGSHLEQSDGTSWMAMFSLNMLTIALELANENPAYEDLATKFLEHFLYIAEALNNVGEEGLELWDETDGFYYDALLHPNGQSEHLKVRSIVGLIPMFAVETLDAETLVRFPAFRQRMDWFLAHRPNMMANVASVEAEGAFGRRLLSLVNRDRLLRVLHRMLDPQEFLSDFGIRSVSKVHEKQPFMLTIDGHVMKLDYEPAESTTEDFGGNSNWRGPIWFPINYLLIESLQKYDFYYGNSLEVDMPTGSGSPANLASVAAELERRLLSLFLDDGNGRPCTGGSPSPGKDFLLFHEYFDADSGRGCGASHQTGWTALIAKIIQQLYVTNPHEGRPD